MKFIVKPIVCDYAVVSENGIICICNIRANAELIADILNGDYDNCCAYSYEVYPNAKYNVIKRK